MSFLKCFRIISSLNKLYRGIGDNSIGFYVALDFLYLILSVVGLYFGAEFALDAAEKIGDYFGLPPLLIGVFIIGFGTSLPEFFVSQIACYRGYVDISLGNIVGSNIANLYLILGVTGILTTLELVRKVVRVQLIFHLVLTVLLSSILIYQKINYVSTILFLTFFSVYLYYSYQEMKRNRALFETFAHAKVHIIGASTYIKLASGFILLYFGGELLVSSGKQFGTKLGISEYVLSTIFVAFGTSFPELVTALLACFKKKNVDLILGNIIGSNIFNVAFVLGSIGFYNFEISIVFTREIIMLLSASLFLLFLNLFGKNLARFSGILFLSGYVFAIYSWIVYY